MKVKIKVSTPAGQAKATAWKLKPFLIGFNKVKTETYVSANDDIIYIDVEGDARRVLKVTANAYSYATMIDQVFKKKVMGKGVIDALNEKDAAELKSMLKDGTKVEVIKEATAEEMVDVGTTLWERIKRTFKRVDNENQTKED